METASINSKKLQNVVSFSCKVQQYKNLILVQERSCPSSLTCQKEVSDQFGQGFLILSRNDKKTCIVIVKKLPKNKSSTGVFDPIKLF